MTFQSILFERTDDAGNIGGIEPPLHFGDLNIDQIVDVITVRKQEYNLKPFFHIPLHDGDAVEYRQEIALDLENETLLENIRTFAQQMSTVRRYIALADKLYYKYHEEGWFLEAVETYCEAVACLAHDLNAASLKSRGLLSFREYMTTYVNSDYFKSLVAETKKVRGDLSSVTYSIIVKNGSVTVRKYESEIDYSVVVEKTFEKFKQATAKDYRVKLPIRSGMNQVEAQILDFVAKLYPEIFLNLDNYCVKHRNYLNETIAVFDREIQFYVAYLEYISKLKQAGLQFCYPQISCTDKEIYDYEGFDLALAHKLITEGSPVVCNDFYLKDKERIIVVSGPNQGGKTTFARTFGQLHYLASLGLPVPGKKARLFLFDRIFTHFEKEEDIENQRGKLQDDLIRIYDILAQATRDSIIIINEILTSTTLKDAVFLGKEILNRIIQLDSLCVCVTFIDELASLSEKTVSMVSTVVPENPALRTYKIVRRPADGLSYAISIAEKYRVTYEYLKERIRL
ncbi:MAG: MutS-related protein [Desulfomonilaceae bacterium]